MTRILDGKKNAAAIRGEVKAAVKKMTAAGARPPGLAAMLVGDDAASQIYVRSKTRLAKKAGFVEETVRLPETSSATEVRAALEGLNERDDIDGILLQLPLPAGLPSDELVGTIAPAKDVDGLTTWSAGRLWQDRAGLVPATPRGVIELLRREEIELQGARAVIVGRSQLVGKPLAALLLREQATVTVCHSRTRDLAGVCREADVLIAAVGRLALIGPDHVRDGAVVIDVGIHRVTDGAEVERLFPGDEGRRATFAEKGAVVAGDVDYTRVAPKAAAITPVPGGVGPLTVACLLANTLQASRARQGLEEG